MLLEMLELCWIFLGSICSIILDQGLIVLPVTYTIAIGVVTLSLVHFHFHYSRILRITLGLVSVNLSKLMGFNFSLFQLSFFLW